MSAFDSVQDLVTVEDVRHVRHFHDIRGVHDVRSDSVYYVYSLSHIKHGKRALY